MLLAGFLAAASAQQTLPPSDLPFLPLGPGDVIQVTVEGENDLTRRLTVSPKGEIEMPLLKAPLKVDRIKIADVETLITEAYKDQRLLIQPLVHVAPLEYHSYLVKVTGAVVRPYEFQALEPVSLLSVIAKAGGPATTSNGQIEIISKDGKQSIAMRNLIDDPDPKYNPMLRGGEEVHLPEAAKPAKP
jgi:polysaccharide export outer membrane protein